MSDQNEAKKSQFQNFVNLIFWVILLFLKSVLSVIPTIMWVLSCAVSLAITRPWIEAFEGDQEFNHWSFYYNCGWNYLGFRAFIPMAN